MPTRWQYCGVYGHLNNVTDYSHFDIAVTSHLLREGSLKSQETPVICTVVETNYNFREELGFLDVVGAGIKVVQPGNSSGSAKSAYIAMVSNDTPATFGHFVHALINRKSRPSTGTVCVTASDSANLLNKKFSLMLRQCSWITLSNGV